MGSPALEQDPDRDLRRAAALDELDSRVEVDVVAGGERFGCLDGVAGTLQLFAPPALDALDLASFLDVSRSHCLHLAFVSSFIR